MCYEIHFNSDGGVVATVVGIYFKAVTQEKEIRPKVSILALQIVETERILVYLYFFQSLPLQRSARHNAEWYSTSMSGSNTN